MPLSQKDLGILTYALGYEKTLAQEFAAALFVPAPLSLKLQKTIIAAMANKPAALEVINALETGNQVLDAKTIKIFQDMLGIKYNSADILSLLNLSSAGILLLLAPAATYSAYAALVSNSGASSLIGNVGVAVGGSISGSPTISNGSAVLGVNAAPAAAAIQTAYAALAAKTGATSLTGQNLGGLTLTPGVYNYASSAALNGTLVLNAQGNPNAVFIIQVGSSLTAAANSVVTLEGGATSANVYWQVGSSATIGADSVFAGNVLAMDSITLAGGASSNGALFAMTGVLTLNNNIVSPAPVNPLAIPPVPTALVITPGNLQVTPVWVSSIGATSYNLYYNTVGAPTKLSTQIAGAVSGVALTGLTNGTTYYYVVTAVNTAGESAISAVASATPTASAVATPTFSPVAGSYSGTQSVTISTITAGSTIYYTTDGSTPTVFSTLYSAPVSVLATETIKALAVKSGLANSAVASAAYTITHAGPAPVNLASAANYRILSESGISTTAGTAITGNIAVSPIASTAITGFGLVLDGSGTFSTSSLVTGDVYAASYSAPTPATLTTAISDMQAAYTDAAGRTTPDFTNLGSGNIGGLTLVPGLYKWTTGVTIPTNVTFNGGAGDVWIMQIAGNLSLSTSTQVLLSGGALASNIFWQVAGSVTLGVSSTFCGIILGETNIAVGTTATIHGAVYAQTAVTLDNDVIGA